MVEVLKKQYALVQKSRSLMLTFIKDFVGTDLTSPVIACQNKDIRHLLFHNADCYIYWLQYMALEETVEWLQEDDFTDIEAILNLYNNVDQTMGRFLNHFKENINLLVDNSRTKKDKLSASPMMIFTHVITHEFHHKGQIMSICRQLGHVPPETDIYQFFY